MHTTTTRAVLRTMAGAAAALLAATVTVVLDDGARAGGGDAREATSDVRVVTPPRNRAKLMRWLRKRRYRNTFTPEPSAHASAGPHGGVVRTWFNAQLVDDLANDRRPFSKRAAIVKELFLGQDPDGKPRGWAVMVKVRSAGTSKRRHWWYFETFDRRGLGDYFGRGIRVCSSCHSAGDDYLLTRFRPTVE